MRDPKDRANGVETPGANRMFLLSLGCLIVGSVGYFTLQRDVWVFYLFAHCGALGVMGLFGVAAGALATKKGRDYWPAFYLGSLLPIVSGMVAVLLLLSGEQGRLYCGGSVSLLVAALVILVYSLARTRAAPQAGHSVDRRSRREPTSWLGGSPPPPPHGSQ